VVSSELASACDLKMGYRTTARLPNIEAEPSNAGLYFDLYSQAAKMVSCNLVVIRMPKKRILRGIQEGTIDFYPGLTYSDIRSDYIFFFENGLPSLDVGLSRIELGDISSYYDLENKVVLLALGGPELPTRADKYGYIVRTSPELSFEKAVNIILEGKADFYEDDIGTLSFYLKDRPRKTELKYHFNCCGGPKVLTLGFSRSSTHYSEELNSDYDPTMAQSPYNLPIRLAQNSKAKSFYQALRKLKTEGFTDSLYERYYGIHPIKVLKGNE